MFPSAEEQACVHCMSQLVYLDTVPSMGTDGAVTIGSMADYYLEHPAGQAFLRARFGAIRREYELWVLFLSARVDRWRDWRIIGVLDDNASEASGFYGCTYRSPEGLSVVAFRGSEQWGKPPHENDYRNDFALSYEVPTIQQRVVEQYWRGLPPAGAFWVTGHSLGGNLALYSAATMPGYLWRRCLGCFALNAPGFSREFLTQYAAVLDERAERVYALQNEYDMVSSLLRNAVEPFLVRSAYDPWAHHGLVDLLYPHSNFQFSLRTDGSFDLLEKGEKSSLCQMANQLTEVVLSLPVSLRKALAERALEAVYQPPSERMDYALEGLTKTLSHHSAQSAALPAANVAYMAELLNGTELTGALHGYKAAEGPFYGHQLAHILLLLLRMVFVRTDDPQGADYGKGRVEDGKLGAIMVKVTADHDRFRSLGYHQRLETCLEVNRLIGEQGGPKNSAEHYFRNRLNEAPASLEDMLAEIRAPKEITWHLMSPEQSGYHMFGADGEYNLKFVSGNGLFEAVYNKDGALLTERNDAVNMGTYNYADPVGHPEKHLLCDVLPYYIWGNVQSSEPHGRKDAAQTLRRFYLDEDAVKYHQEMKSLIERTAGTE